MRTILIGLSAILAASPAIAEPLAMAETDLAGISAGLDSAPDVYGVATVATITNIDGVVTRRSETVTLTGPGTVVLGDGTELLLDDTGAASVIGPPSSDLVDVGIPLASSLLPLALPVMPPVE